MNVAGRWRIVEMSLWDREAIDLLGSAFVEICPGHDGRFRFIALEGRLDTRVIDLERRPGHRVHAGQATTRAMP